MHHPGHSVLPSLHPHPRAALNPSLVLTHLWCVPMPRFCHLSEGTALHPIQVLLLWPPFMPASELNTLHSSQGPAVKEDLGTSSHPRLQFSGEKEEEAGKAQFLLQPQADGGAFLLPRGAGNHGGTLPWEALGRSSESSKTQPP